MAWLSVWRDGEGWGMGRQRLVLTKEPVSEGGDVAFGVLEPVRVVGVDLLRMALLEKGIGGRGQTIGTTVKRGFSLATHRTKRCAKSWGPTRPIQSREPVRELAARSSGRVETWMVMKVGLRDRIVCHSSRFVRIVGNGDQLT